ncbi:hypothetical protein KC19_4G110600 [Ceratodon purpureus]|uniref:Uncharacterized protein n=1 Tax=Ceratodon purpureus TaxID=3225 RepID=A0A8T0IA16_CERPU|nr:hypothetical protein KC19_4G110600 [Ceratodon purpureus]
MDRATFFAACTATSMWKRFSRRLENNPQSTKEYLLGVKSSTRTSVFFSGIMTWFLFSVTTFRHSLQDTKRLARTQLLTIMKGQCKADSISLEESLNPSDNLTILR